MLRIARTVRSANIGDMIFRLLSYIIVIAAAAAVLIPLIWVVITSLKANNEIMAGPYVLPRVLQFANYARAFDKAGIGGYFLNSVLVVVISMTLLMLLIVPAAYSITRIRFRGAGLLLSIYIGCMFLQVNVLLVPIFLLVTDLGLYNTRISVWIILAVIQVPFTTFLLSNYMRQISREFDNAAMIDGASHFQILRDVTIPLSKPAIVTIVILSFLSLFNEYILTFILISDSAKWTIAVGIVDLFEVQQRATDWGALFAGLVMVMVPTIIVYAAGQRSLLRGMSFGGLK